MTNELRTTHNTVLLQRCASC